MSQNAHDFVPCRYPEDAGGYGAALRTRVHSTYADHAGTAGLLHELSHPLLFRCSMEMILCLLQAEAALAQREKEVMATLNRRQEAQSLELRAAVSRAEKAQLHHSKSKTRVFLSPTP